MTEIQARQLGRVFQKARQKKGLSLRAIEELTGISYPWVARLEQGDFAAPATERLTQLAELLDLDPERIDRLSRGQVSAALPEMRTYLRTKYELSPDQITRIEAVVKRVRKRGEVGHDDGNDTTAK